MIKVELVNIKKYENDDYIYIGRPSKYGNPFSSKEKSLAEYKTTNRKESISKFRQYILENLYILDELISEMNENNINKLGCYCSPKSCHGDILKQLIEEKTSNSIF